MLALVLMDHALRHRAQNADVVCLTPKVSGKISKKMSALSRSRAKPEPTENPDPDEA
jgi:chorismate synthase